MGTREYRFVSGVETASLPSATTPSTSADIITKGFADANYTQGKASVADVAALKAVDSADRTDGMLVVIQGTNTAYIFDAGSSASGDDNTVITPTSGTGRWIKVRENQLTASRALVSSSDGYVTTSAVTATEVALLSGRTGTLATLAGAEVFTNKDIDGGTAANTRRITLPKDTLTNLTSLNRKEGTIVYATDQQKAYIDNGSGLTPVGSGSGTGSGINHIDNPDAETDASGYATYSDAAGTTPVDGTGGSANITWTRSTSSPLRGGASFLFTKDAANRQGEGVSYDFTIDDADKSKMLSITFDYEIESGTFSSGDLTVYIYDVTNSQLIQPAGHSIQNVGIESKHTATFQTNSNSTSYRLIFHVTSTSASAYTVKIDNINVGPQTVLYGAPITDWKAFTPTGTWTANTTYSGFWRRVGDSAEIQYRITLTGAPTAASLFVNMPSGMTIDSTKVASTSYDNIIGFAGSIRGGPGMSLVPFYSSTSAIAIAYPVSSGGTHIVYNNVTASAPSTWANGDFIVVHVRVPIQGWSSNVQMSDSADTRVVAATVNKSGTQALTGTTATKVTGFTVASDGSGLWDAANNRYVIKTPGFYRVSMMIRVASATVSGSFQINGTTTVECTPYVPVLTQGSATTKSALNAGDYIEMIGYVSSNDTISATSTTFQIERLSGPSAIASSESVQAIYKTAAAQSISATTTSIINFDTKEEDSHQAVTTGASWKFTAPISGVYDVEHLVLFNTASWTQAGTPYVDLYKNGSLHAGISGTVSPYSGSYYPQRLTGSRQLRMLAGEYIDLRVYNPESGSRSLINNSAYVWVCIKRVGN